MTGRRRREAGFGLMILVALTAIAGILITATSLLLSEMARETLLRTDTLKAYDLAQAGVMRALYDWRISSNNEANRRYAELTTTVTGNQIFRTGSQADFAYFTFDLGQNTEWNTTGGFRRLRRWRIRNIHTSVPGTGDEIRVTRVRVSWTPAGAVTMRQLQLNGVAVVPVGAYASGTDILLSGTPAQRLLLPGSVWSGNTTFIEWSAAPPNPVTVTVQWTFEDDSNTKDSKSHVVTYWAGDQGGAGRPGAHTFSILATGQVDQTAGGAFKVLNSLRATVSGTPGGGASMEIMDWDRVEKNLT